MTLPVNRSDIMTPCYFYDMKLLSETLGVIKQSIKNKRVDVHYAIKANSEPEILKMISANGLGADCVSIGEVIHAIECNFPKDKIVYAGVGKTDAEIQKALEIGIGCFNVESIEEIDIINEIASKTGHRPRVALRINPDIDAHTHHYITTGLAENKFGIDHRLLDEAVDRVLSMPSLNFVGLHFHIGSQILTTEPFRILCERVNVMVKRIRERTGCSLEYINVGGGLGIDYDNPDVNSVADFKDFFDTITSGIEISDGTRIHCELGRSIVAQCGTLLTRVIYVKKGQKKQFAIVDAGMNNLIRPALYGAYHKIEKIGETSCCHETYDVVGPICESSDCFGEDIKLPCLNRGDMLAIRSTGAYGQTMASNYNMRPTATTIFDY